MYKIPFLLSAFMAIFTGAIFYAQSELTEQALLILNMENNHVLPKSFRKIPELLASGSGQFSEESLKAILENLPTKNIRIVDLRQESHGFINGMAVSWFVEHNSANQGKTLEEIEQDEKDRLNELLKMGNITVFTRAYVPFHVYVTKAATEKELAAEYSLQYVRLPITDHLRPLDEEIDKFVQMIKDLPKDIWIHFHCFAGRGRTTTFMAMLDMMRNANVNTLDEIAHRQESAGGLNILKPADVFEWKYPYILERIEFVKKFYLYCQDVPNFDIPWSEWNSNH